MRKFLAALFIATTLGVAGCTTVVEDDPDRVVVVP
jgi:hypothetical protein